MKEKLIISLQLLKNKLIRAGGVLKFLCTIELINFIKNARVKYFADVELQKLTVEKEKQQKMLQVESQEVDESNKKKLAKVESEIERLRNNLQIADAMVYYGNKQLQKLLCSTSKNIERKKIQSAQSKINIGLERKRKCDDDLAEVLGTKQEIAKRIVLHPYPMPITDPTHLLEISVFLFRVFRNMSSY